MGLFGSQPKQSNEDFATEPDFTSAYASYEAALRETLEPVVESTSAQPPTNTLPEHQERAKVNFRRLFSIILWFIGLLSVFALVWAIGFGPINPYFRQMISQLNERAMAPIATETESFTATKPLPKTTTPVPSDSEVNVVEPTPTLDKTTQPTVSYTATEEGTQTPEMTPTTTPEVTPTFSLAGCVPASSITLEDVGKELCVTAYVFKAEVFETYFSVRTGEDFYFVSYAKGWYEGYGTTWELKKGACVYAVGKIERIGSFPLMQVGYKNPLKLCEEP
jgi:hypothetical protein